MKEKEVWTLDGRKKILLVNECNQVIKEIEDLGPLSKTELLWLMQRPGIPYKDWLKEYEKAEKEKNHEQEKNKKTKDGKKKNRKEKKGKKK